MASVVIEMNVVFEDYVRNVLEAATAGDPRLDVLDGNHEGAKRFFDSEPSEDANPDIVFRVDGEATPVVMDVKYKPASKMPDRSDLNQVIAYGLSYRADAVAVVQPRAEGSTRSRLISLGTISGMRVYQYVFDMDADLAQEETTMVAALAGLVPAEASAQAKLAAVSS
jgi:5-methylcytosine-specific restriction enzyme subunit McrC